MSRKSILTIVIGVVVFAATLVVSNVIFASTAPSSAEIMASPQTQIEKLQLAGIVQTTFLFIAIVELLTAGMLAYQWRKTAIPHQANSKDQTDNHKASLSTLVQFSVYTGTIAFVTSYVALLLNVFIFEAYGGVGSHSLICPGIPAGLLGVLGGIAWLRIKWKSKSTLFRLVSLLLVGIAAGILPGACIMLLPQ